jgi:hypothetical protein
VTNPRNKVATLNLKQGQHGILRGSADRPARADIHIFPPLFSLPANVAMPQTATKYRKRDHARQQTVTLFGHVAGAAAGPSDLVKTRSDLISQE